MTLVPPGLNFGSALGWPFDPVWPQRFVRDGFAHIRIAGHGPAPIFERASAEQCRDACGQMLDLGLQPLITVRDSDQVTQLQHGTLVEHFNEADITSNGWQHERDLANMYRIIEKCAERALKLYVGGAVSGLHKRGFAHLSRYDWKNIPEHIGVSIHRYATDQDCTKVTDWGGSFLSKPPKPWRERADEVKHLFDLVGSRPVAVTECGVCSAEYSEAQQCEAMRYEREFWSQYAEVLCAYTYTDDPRGTNCESTFGLYDVDGNLKPHGAAFLGRG